MKGGRSGFLVLAAALALPAAAVPSPGRAEPADGPRLTPPPAYTAVIPSVTAAPADVPGGKPLPRVMPPSSLHLPPPVSPPLAGTPMGREGPGAVPAIRAEAPPPATPAAPAATRIAPAPEPPPAAAPAERRLLVTTSAINVRARPDGDSRKIDELEAGKTVEALGPVQNGKWQRVARKGEVLGYASTEFLKPAGDAARPTASPPVPAAAAPSQDAPPSGERVVRYAATEINVRPRPDQDARRIDVIDEGTRLEVVGPVVNKEWVKVFRSGRELGYVSKDYLLPRPPRPH